MTSLETLTLEKKGERKSSIERDSRSSVLSHRFLNKCAPLTNFFCLFLYLFLSFGGEGSLFKTLTKTRARARSITRQTGIRHPTAAETFLRGCGPIHRCVFLGHRDRRKRHGGNEKRARLSGENHGGYQGRGAKRRGSID